MKQDRTRWNKVIADLGMMAIVRQLIRHRQTAMARYRQEGRQALANREREKIELLESYLPPGLKEEEAGRP